MGGAVGLISPLLSLAMQSGGGGGGGGGGGAPVQTANPAAVATQIGNQFATSGTFNSPMRVEAQVQGANQAQGQNALTNARLAQAFANQMAAQQTPAGFSAGFNQPSTNTSTPGELGIPSGDPVQS